ncbi:MAG: fused MFS/spermidine synthase [Bryobacteraceae bacterium]|nr:fused MFS/spermidine synthase [Bryobacteraceae bacterium]
MALFPITIFLSAFLLFSVQPIVARQLLPLYGGTPALWTACLLFFQAALIVGYQYAHRLSRVPVGAQRLDHTLILMLPLLTQAWAGPVEVSDSGDPTWNVIKRLLLVCGLEAIALSATSPLLQQWYAGPAPYRLYAVSNAGSLLALLAYPAVIEPWVPLRWQLLGWRAGYWIFAALCAVVAWKQASAKERAAPIPVTYSQFSLWLLLSALGAMLLAATTNQLTLEVAVSPFLWVLPLGIYLACFILVFQSDRWYRPDIFGSVAAIAVMLACIAQVAGVSLPLWSRLAIYCLALFTGCMVCFGELVARKPEPGALTKFYLAIAWGGALGTAFVALVAPHLFTNYTEFPLALMGCMAVRYLGWRQEAGLARYAVPGLAMAAALVLLARQDTDGVLERRRNFFGTLRVASGKDEIGPRRELHNGTILHGFQYTDADKRGVPTAYYGPKAGAGAILSRLGPAPARIGIVGLGVGTLARYGRDGDRYRFYEINPDVVEIARTQFTYLRDSAAQVDIVLGDARRTLEREREPFDVLVVDAFSSDAIPTHLLTLECARLYQSKLKPGGALLIHISNKSVDLAPVVRGFAGPLGWRAARLHAKGYYGSTWMVLTDNAALLELPAIRDLTTVYTAKDRAPLIWTDDFASLWRVLRF